MKSILASRLVDSQPLLPRLISNKGDGTLGDKSPSMEKILVFGGNGFVGSHICREALERGLTVHSLSTSGRPSYQDSWTNSIVWHQGDLLSPDSLKSALTGVTSVILKHAKLLSKIQLIGPLFIPLVHVTSVAKVAVTAAMDPPFPPGIIDIHGILQLAHQKSA
ncbi:uncharacterized protein LOC123226156 isoform X2 [Mangifera indica]|uniref:uncharacterized protein LOC123226156 isoform X2 n=1 Tax=Mangifera indica TaxID=29780 RepID=UPI001CFA8353|nr:uncharacterized protein LOC123226156 isoform X2 [Mangifera indica]